MPHIFLSIDRTTSQHVMCVFYRHSLLLTLKLAITLESASFPGNKTLSKMHLTRFTPHFCPPRAVLFFTGEALDEEDSDEDSEDEDDDEDEDQDSDQDEDFDPSKAKANPECKQQ